MSAKKMTKFPGFELDPETGKLIPIPGDLSAYFGLKPTPMIARTESNNHVTQPHKYQKTNSETRRELFKVPAANKQSTPNRKRVVSARRSLTKTLCSTSNTNISKKQGTKLERKFAVSNSPLKTPKTTLNDESLLLRTPETPIDEFLLFEQQFKTPNPKSKVKMESPVTSICSLLEDTMNLNGDVNQSSALVNASSTSKQTLSDIKRILDLDMQLCADTAKKIQEVIQQQMEHEKNLKLMSSLLAKMSGSSDEEKENRRVRRSDRLQNKSITNISTQSQGRVTSPVVLKAGDLLKSTLTRNLPQKFKNASPIADRATFYDKMKHGTGLETPKLKKYQDASLASSMQGISSKLKQQCFVLEDTPRK